MKSIATAVMVLWFVCTSAVSEEINDDNIPEADLRFGITGLGVAHGGLIGRIVLVPDSNGGVWRMDSETGRISRCWTEIDLMQAEVDRAIPFDGGYAEKYQKKPVCSAWTEY
jgi:hypothetical protein